MIYYRAIYSNECACRGTLVRGVSEYVAFKTWGDVNKYLNNIRKNYPCYLFYEIDPEFIGANPPRFKIYK